MRETLTKYRQAIQSGRINPVARWDGQSSRTLFDPADPNVPLQYMAFGAYNLSQGPFNLQTADREYVLIPISGDFEITAAGITFAGSRPGGPFAAEPELSNASAVYLGRDCKADLTGSGEMIWFSAPAAADKNKNPVFVKPGDRKQIRRGTGLWRREVITLVTTDDFSTNLIVGETYCPPGLWSGMPIHLHDSDDNAGGQSDHEEVDYHLARVADGQWGPYGVQLLFDDQGLDKAYMVHNRDAVAIPGGAHPVITGPASDMIYVWAHACSGTAKSKKLKMFNIPEFQYLEAVGAILDRLEIKGDKLLSNHQLAALADEYNLVGAQREILRQHLLQQGFKIQ